MILCSGISDSCMPPITYETMYKDGFSCMVDGYKKSLDKTIKLGVEEVNKYKLYIKFGCAEILIPKPKPKVII